ncbi:MAG: hypothetical protein RH917_06155 [Lacipirellulaceae bacterium]
MLRLFFISDAQIVGTRRLKLSRRHRIEDLSKARDGFRFLPREEVSVGVHRQSNGRMPHHGLHRFDVNALHGQPGTTSMSKTVKVESLTVAVLCR